MRVAGWALSVALAAAVAPVAAAQEPGLQLGLGGFHQGFLIGRDQSHTFSERVRGQEFYHTSVGPLELSASVGGEPGEAVTDVVGIGGDRLLSAGLQLGYGGFLGGLAYGFGDQGFRYEEQHRLSAGVRYSLDSFSFGPAFAVNWQEGSQSQPQRVYMLELGASYSLAPGIDAMGSLQHSRTERGRSSNVGDDEGTAGLFGISLSF